MKLSTEGQIYTIYAYDLHYNFDGAPTIEKFNPQLIFHNSNTEAVDKNIIIGPCSNTLLHACACNKVLLLNCLKSSTRAHTAYFLEANSNILFDIALAQAISPIETSFFVVCL